MLNSLSNAISSFISSTSFTEAEFTNNTSLVQINNSILYTDYYPLQLHLQKEERISELKSILDRAYIFLDTESAYKKAVRHARQTLCNNLIFTDYCNQEYIADLKKNKFHMICMRDVKRATVEDIWNIFAFLSYSSENTEASIKIQSAKSSAKTIRYKQNKALREQQASFDIRYTLHLASFASLLLERIDPVLLYLVSSYNNLIFPREDRRQIDRLQLYKTISTMRSNLLPITMIEPEYPQLQRLDMNLTQCFLCIFALIDNCNLTSIEEVLESGDFQAWILTNMLISYNDYGKSDRIAQAFVIGIRKRIASYLRDRTIIRSIMRISNMPLSQPRKYTIFSLPDEILCSLYSIYHPDRQRVTVLSLLINEILRVSHIIKSSIFNSQDQSRLDLSSCAKKIEKIHYVRTLLKDILEDIEEREINYSLII